MILARCPHCDTTFRATAEALKARAGKVRCGKCKKAFNALQHLTEETPDAPEKQAALGAAFELVPPPAGPVPAALATEGPDSPEGPTEPARPSVAAAVGDAPGEPAPDAAPTDVIEAGDGPVPADPLLDAQTAGLVAARDTRDIPGYSKWSEGTFAAGAPGFVERKRTNWLYVLLIVLLGFMAAVQATYLYRTEIASRWPDLRPWLEEACVAVACTVPYPADADQIDIQASELQADTQRGGLLVLHLTLQNRSDLPQTYPSIELTLTDVREQVVVRRILAPSDWLPARLENRWAFPPHGEIAARIWLDPQDTGAVGYSLKVVYP
jgi:predicted Zn finger-like uncharacterized protein